MQRRRRVAEVSIHAPGKGATSEGAPRVRRLIGFDPRPREGGDQGVVQIQRRQIAVSIHAPGKGATIALQCPRLSV